MLKAEATVRAEEPLPYNSKAVPNIPSGGAPCQMYGKLSDIVPSSLQYMASSTSSHFMTFILWVFSSACLLSRANAVALYVFHRAPHTLHPTLHSPPSVALVSQDCVAKTRFRFTSLVPSAGNKESMVAFGKSGVATEYSLHMHGMWCKHVRSSLSEH